MSSLARPSLLRFLQTLTAGAAVFALLGACGIPINHPQRPRYQRVRPIIVRLSGTWDAVPVGEDSFRPLRLTLRHTGASVEGVLHLADRDVPTEWPGRIDPGGQFTLAFGRPPERIRIALQIEARGRRLGGTLVDPRGREPVLFLRR
jgi:hypothetical protein